MKIDIKKCPNKGLHIYIENCEEKFGTYIILEKPISDSHIKLIERSINFIFERMEEIK